MNLRSILAPLAALLLLLVAAAPARAQSAHTGHDPARKCVWQADKAPSFVPGCSAVYDSGSTVRVSCVFESVVGRTSWNVIVLPGYQFGWVYALDEGVPLASTCSKSYARSSIYRVLKSIDCCRPQRHVKPLMAASFRVRAAQLNSPGRAHAQAVTHVVATNTGLSCVAAAAATTNADDSGQTLGVEIPLVGGAKAKISFNLDFDSEDETIDEASSVTVGATKPVPDEEYAISTDLDLDASADGAPWDTGEAEAQVSNHSLFIQTAVECKHCLAKGSCALYIHD